MILSVLSWIAMGLSITGNIYVNRKNVLGMYIWTIGSTLWMIYAISTHQWAQLAMFSVYTYLNVDGVIRWRTGGNILTHWEIKTTTTCADCGEVTEGYRVVESGGYDKSTDKNPEFRCKDCRDKKVEELRQRGVSISE